MASALHIVINKFRNLLEISLETKVIFAKAQLVKNLLSDPEKMLAMLAASAAVSAPHSVSAAAAAEK